MGRRGRVSRRDVRLLELLEARGGLTLKELARTTGISEKQLGPAIWALEDRKLLELRSRKYRPTQEALERYLGQRALPL